MLMAYVSALGIAKVVCPLYPEVDIVPIPVPAMIANTLLPSLTACLFLSTNSLNSMENLKVLQNRFLRLVLALLTVIIIGVTTVRTQADSTVFKVYGDKPVLL